MISMGRGGSGMEDSSYMIYRINVVVTSWSIQVRFHVMKSDVLQKIKHVKVVTQMLTKPIGLLTEKRIVR